MSNTCYILLTFTCWIQLTPSIQIFGWVLSKFEERQNYSSGLVKRIRIQEIDTDPADQDPQHSYDTPNAALNTSVAKAGAGSRSRWSRHFLRRLRLRLHVLGKQKRKALFLCQT